MEPRLERPVESPRRRGSAALARLATSPVTSRVIVFAGADVLTTALGGIVTLLLARSLSTTQYGSYSFATSALAFAAMFFEFGLFLPTARRLAQGRDHIRLYSLTRTATRAAAAAALGALLLAGHRLSVALALAVESGALL